jgi:hypothetical protein
LSNASKGVQLSADSMYPTRFGHWRNLRSGHHGGPFEAAVAILNNTRNVGQLLTLRRWIIADMWPIKRSYIDVIASDRRERGNPIRSVVARYVRFAQYRLRRTNSHRIPRAVYTEQSECAQNDPSTRLRAGLSGRLRGRWVPRNDTGPHASSTPIGMNVCG